MSSTDKQYYVLKSINKHMKAVKNKSRLYRFWGNNAIDSLRTEANILKELNHPNVVQLVEVIVDNRMNDFILIEELVPGRIVMEESVSALSFPLTARSPQTPIPTTKAVQIFRGILKGIYYCHAHNVVHGDFGVSYECSKGWVFFWRLTQRVVDLRNSDEHAAGGLQPQHSLDVAADAAEKSGTPRHAPVVERGLQLRKVSRRVVAGSLALHDDGGRSALSGR